MIPDRHAGVDGANGHAIVEIVVHDGGRTLVVETAGLEAHAPVGKQVGIVVQLVAEGDLGLQLLERVGRRRDRAAHLAGVDLPAADWIKHERHQIFGAAAFDVITQGQTHGELLHRLPVKRAEGGIDIGTEAIVEQLAGRVGRAGRVVERRRHALAQIGAQTDAGFTIDVEVIEANRPVDRTIQRGGIADFRRNVLLLAGLQLGAVTRGRAVGTISGSGARIEDERCRAGADERRRIQRIARQLQGGGGALGGHGLAGRAGARESVAREIGGCAIGRQRLIDIGIQHPAGDLARAEIMLHSGRGFKGGLLVGRADVAVITEWVAVHIFIEGRVHRREVGQVETGVEVDRGAGQLGIAALHVERGGLAQLGDDATIDAVIFLIVDNLGIAQEFVAPETIGGLIIGRQHEADGIRQRAGDIAKGLTGGEFAIISAERAFKHVARLDRGHHDGASRRVAAIDGALRALQHFHLAQRALHLIELRRVGFQNAVNHQRHARFSVAGAVETADVDLGVAGFRRTRNDGHAGRELQDFLAAEGAGGGQRFGSDHRHAGRHVDQPFAVAAGRHQNLAGPVVCGNSLLGHGRRGGQNQARNAKQKPGQTRRQQSASGRQRAASHQIRAGTRRQRPHAIGLRLAVNLRHVTSLPPVVTSVS